MKLNEIGMLLASTPRSNAYLQALLRNNLFPVYILLLDDSEGKIAPGQIHPEALKEMMTDMALPIDAYFDLKISIPDIIRKNNIPCQVSPTCDVNSNWVVEHLTARPEKYFIYSGYGGVILKERLLECGKKFLHLHSGRVPDQRGSTTIYYSILTEDKCFVSALFLDKDIDTGALIKIKSYDKPANGELIDYIYDPYIRSDLLVDVVKDYLKDGRFYTQPQQKEIGETYFIIHPVLKHIAILSCEGNR